MIKKILFIIANTNIGGAQRNLIQLATEMSKKYNIYFMILRQEGELSNELKSFNIEILLINQKSTYDIKSYIRVFKIIRELEPDIIHTQLFFSNNIARFAKFLGIYKKVLISGERTNTFSSPWTKQPLYSIALFIDKFFSKYTDVIVSNNDELKENFSLLGYSTANIVIINNGIELIDIYNNHSEGTDKVFCFVGRLEDVKNLFFLCDQFALLANECNNISLKIVGDGKLYIKLQQYIITKKYKFIYLLGSLLKTEVYNEILIADICILPSFYEGFPNTLLEYGLFRKPVIVSNIKGSKIVINNDDVGYVFDLSKKNDLYHKMKYSLIHYEESLIKGENLRIRIEKNFSLFAMIHKFEKLYVKKLKNYE